MSRSPDRRVVPVPLPEDWFGHPAAYPRLALGGIRGPLSAGTPVTELDAVVTEGLCLGLGVRGVPGRLYVDWTEPFPG